MDSQEYRCRQYAEAKEYQVEAVFPDDVTGRGDFMNRPGMVALLAYMDAHPNERFVVIFDDLKRYSRDTEFHLKLRRIMGERGATRECLNYTFQDGPIGKFFETMAVAHGELEREETALQSRQKSKARIEQGFAIRSIPPIGFEYVKTKDRGKVLHQVEPVASIIREALESFASGRFQSQAEIVRFLEAQPSFPKKTKDGRVRQMTVKRMLSQVLYGGYVQMPSWGVSMRDGQHEGIVSKETFWRIQDRLKERPTMPARKDMRDDFPLRGAVACASCGYSLTGGWCQGKYKKYPYYFCHHRGCANKGKTIPAAKLEARMEAVLKSLQPSRAFLNMAAAMFKKAWSGLDQHQAKVARAFADKARELESDIGKIVDRMVDVTNARALKAFEERIETLEREKLRAEEMATKTHSSKGAFEELFELSMQFLANPYECWKTGGSDTRKLVWRLAFDGPLLHHRDTGLFELRKSSVFRVLDGLEVSWKEMVPPE